MLRSRRGRRIALLAFCVLFSLAAAGLLFLRPPGREQAPIADPPNGLTAYDVTLKLLPDSREISLTEHVTYRNDTGEALDHLILRTWLNAYRTEQFSPAAADEWYDTCYPEGFNAGQVTIYDVIWKGERASWRYEDEAGTVLRIAIPALPAGESGQLTLRCTGLIPVCAHRIGVTEGLWQLGGAIPLLPLYQDHAFRTDAYSAIGDPFVLPCADFTVHAFLPEGYVPACSAPLEKGADGGWHGSIRGARDIALCASPAYRRATARAGQTAIYAFARTDEAARRCAALARQAVETLSGLYGAYPYPALTVCGVCFPFGGMEYSALAMIGESNFAKDKQDALEVTVAHEAAHQWFYSLVGSDQVFSPWQDEALCQWAMLCYVRARYGQGSYESLRFSQVDLPMAEQIPGQLTPGSPIDYFPTLADYSAVVYGRGAALLAALEEMLPEGADAFLRAYAARFAYQFVTREAFEAFLNDYAGMDLSPLLLDYLDTAH